MPTFKAEQLVEIGTKIFEAAGAPIEEAKLVSEFLVKANLAGHDSHGVIRIIQYIKEIERGFIKPGAKTEVVRETRSSALLNGNWGFGQVIAKRSMEMAIEKAKQNSVGVVCAYNCNHIGRLADYTSMALEDDMIGIAMVNAVKSVAPYGGRERMLSTAPISYAIPSGTEAPLVLDIATSVVAEGKIRVKLHKGEKLPDGWIIDKDGNPSNDPQAFYEGGALLPLGGEDLGHKGFGLGLLVEVLGGILSGSGCAYEANKRGNGIFFEAIDIQSFIPLNEFKTRIDNYIQALKTSKPRTGFNAIVIPGEPEFRTQQQRMREGIYIPERTLEEIANIAKKLNLNIDLLRAYY